MSSADSRSVTGAESIEYVAQPSLWDRLKDDLPGLELESNTLRAELAKELGDAKLTRFLEAKASASDEAALSKDQRQRLDTLKDAERKAKYLARTGIVVSNKDVVAAVCRDIEALLNTARYDCKYLLSESEEIEHPNALRDLSQFPEVQSSVVNYGIVPILGTLRASLDINEFEKELRAALLDFEPRLDPRKLRVEVKKRVRSGDALSAFDVVITGEIRLSPAPEHLRLIAEIDFNTAKTTTRVDER